MIDRQITINSLESLQREVARIEFSTEYHEMTVEAAIKARQAVEKLIKEVKLENDHDEDEE